MVCGPASFHPKRRRVARHLGEAVFRERRDPERVLHRESPLRRDDARHTAGLVDEAVGEKECARAGAAVDAEACEALGEVFDVRAPPAAGHPPLARRRTPLAAHAVTRTAYVPPPVAERWIAS